MDESPVCARGTKTVIQTEGRGKRKSGGWIGETILVWEQRAQEPQTHAPGGQGASPASVSESVGGCVHPPHLRAPRH